MNLLFFFSKISQTIRGRSEERLLAKDESAPDCKPSEDLTDGKKSVKKEVDEGQSHPNPLKEEQTVSTKVHIIHIFPKLLKPVFSCFIDKVLLCKYNAAHLLIVSINPMIYKDF